MNTATPLLLLAVTYIVAIAAAGWHVIDRKRRASIHEQIRHRAASGMVRVAARIKSFVDAPAIGWHMALAVSAAAIGTAWLHRRMLGIGLALFGAPVSLLVIFGNTSPFQSYDDVASRPDPVVAALLDGERLVPPAALPPAVFTMQETSVDRMELATASREWMLLDPDFRERLLRVYRAMERHGYRMALLEGYRSPERQQMLAGLGPHVTNAKAYQSYHQFGLAADSAFYRNDRLVISEKDPWAMEGYRLYGEYAESAGLVWGGRWQMRDFGHVELRHRSSVR